MSALTTALAAPEMPGEDGGEEAVWLAAMAAQALRWHRAMSSTLADMPGLLAGVATMPDRAQGPGHPASAAVRPLLERLEGQLAALVEVLDWAEDAGEAYCGTCLMGLTVFEDWSDGTLAGGREGAWSHFEVDERRMPVAVEVDHAPAVRWEHLIGWRPSYPLLPGAEAGQALGGAR